MTLGELRKKINDTDKKILDLLNERSIYVQEVGKLKNETNGAIYVPEREKQIFEKLTKMNKSKLPAQAIIAIYTEIISACRNLEKNLTISFLGPETSYTHSAAIKQFGSGVSFNANTSIDSVFYNVERGFSDYGVVPIENSTGGTVNYTLDKFIDSNLKIIAEVELKISHCLISLEENFSNIKKIYSHPQAFAQCKNWITSNLKGVELIETSSTSYAAKLASQEKETASISSKLAAEKYSLNILDKGIEDMDNNTTRFFIIGKQLNKKSGKDKTSVMYSPKEQVGALYHSLKYFYENNINLSMIESRPNKKHPWQYLFFIDMEGHYQDENLINTFKKIEESSTDFKILGSYPTKV